MKKFLIVFDFFAGTFSVTQNCLSLIPDFQKVEVNLCKIFAVEKSKELSLNFFHNFLVKNPNKDLVKAYCSDVLSSVFETKMLSEFQKVLSEFKQKEPNSELFVLFFAGPPCQNYSSLQALNSKNAYIQNSDVFIKQQQYSDSLVIKTLYVYSKIKEICHTQSFVFTGIIIENPWSVDTLRVYDVNDPFFEKGYKYSTSLSLRKREFFQPFFFENGGFLKITKHNWCQYDFFNFPKKTTAIFSDIYNIESNVCQHKQKHPINVLSLKTAADRGKYPSGFISYCIFSFLKSK